MRDCIVHDLKNAVQSIFRVAVGNILISMKAICSSEELLELLYQQILSPTSVKVRPFYYPI
jgi:hypothetical protein